MDINITAKMNRIVELSKKFFPYIWKLRICPSIINDREKKIIENLKGKWKYELTYNQQDNQTIVIEGDFEIGDRAGNKGILIEGIRKTIARETKELGRVSMEVITLPEELDRIRWYSSWAQYCDDGILRCIYNMPIIGQNTTIRSLFESEPFFDKTIELTGEIHPLMSDTYNKLLDIQSNQIEISVLDLKIPVSTFFEPAKVKASKEPNQ